MFDCASKLRVTIIAGAYSNRNAVYRILNNCAMQRAGSWDTMSAAGCYLHAASPQCLFYSQQAMGGVDSRRFERFLVPQMF